MPQKLDAITNVVKAATVEEVFDHYRITNLHLQLANPNGAGQLSVTITPCREDNGTCYFDHKKPNRRRPVVSRRCCEHDR
jgi:hypothetical protein